MKGKLILAGLLVAALVAGCGGSKKADQPAAPVTAQPQPGQPVTQGGTADGTYTIVSADSTASYSVHEKFLQQNLPGIAVGKTSAVAGSLVFSAGAVKPSQVTVDVSTLKSDKGQRDQVIKNQGLESSKYPQAEFSITGVEGTVPAIAGQEVAFKLKGNLKIHGTEKPVVWDAKAHTEGNKLFLTGTIQFKMDQFGITPPSKLGIIEVDDNVQLDVTLVGQKS
jgi:polyisoprenoid-binding protein YceI